MPQDNVGATFDLSDSSKGHEKGGRNMCVSVIVHIYIGKGPKGLLKYGENTNFSAVLYSQTFQCGKTIPFGD